MFLHGFAWFLHRVCPILVDFMISQDFRIAFSQVFEDFMLCGFFASRFVRLSRNCWFSLGFCIAISRFRRIRWFCRFPEWCCQIFEYFTISQVSRFVYCVCIAAANLGLQYIPPTYRRERSERPPRALAPFWMTKRIDKWITKF